ncbi:MAG: hypothetical protein Q7S20_01045 [Gemmatimonadaceae bacterium]|nr:hypothetical protein [Gemmatimonadaceae bacterium]
MRHTPGRTAAFFFLVASIPAASAGAQGTLSTQGFGYPTGQLSARALATGGGISEFDPDSPLNPAAIALTSDPRMFLQYEPEFRKLTNGSASSNSTTARFPVASASMPFGSKGSIGLSVATLLDRSSSTTSTREQEVGGVVATITETTRTLGAINDIRLAGGWAPSPKVQFGVGGHVYTGQNRVFFSQSFPDTLKFSGVSQVSTLGFTGFAASAGVLVRPSRNIGFALSGRKGARIEARAGDSTVSKANIPDRYAAGVSYEGIPGSSISAHLAREQWSSLNGLGSSAANAVDTWEGGFGVESLGPRVADRQTVLRLGARYRTLPFTAAGNEVKELSFAGGIGAQFFRNRATFDMTVERAGRSVSAGSLDARERAFILSFGLRVRP